MHVFICVKRQIGTCSLGSARAEEPGAFPAQHSSRLQILLPFQITTVPWKPLWHLCFLNKAGSGPRQRTRGGCAAGTEHWLWSISPTDVSMLQKRSHVCSPWLKPPSIPGSGSPRTGSQAPTVSHLQQQGVLTAKARIALPGPGCCLNTPKRWETSPISVCLFLSLSESCSRFPCWNVQAPSKLNSCLTSFSPGLLGLGCF